VICALQSPCRLSTPNARALDGRTCKGPTARPWRVFGPSTWHLKPLSSFVSRRAVSTCCSPRRDLASFATAFATDCLLVSDIAPMLRDPAHDGVFGATSPLLQYSLSLRKKSAAVSSFAVTVIVNEIRTAVSAAVLNIRILLLTGC